MRKRFLGLLVLIVLLLSACSAAEQVPASETSTPTAEPQPTQTAIIKEDPTETSPTETAASAPVASPKTGRKWSAPWSVTNLMPRLSM